MQIQIPLFRGGVVSQRIISVQTAVYEFLHERDPVFFYRRPLVLSDWTSLLASREGGGNLVVMSGSPTLILSLSKDEMS